MSPPLILGLGGALRPDSSSEQALRISLAAAEAEGARTRLLGGEFMAGLPIFDPRDAQPTPAQAELVAAVREASGVIVATPGYHGSLSGLVKNALDTVELTRNDIRPYFQDLPVGTVTTADGPQAAGGALMALRTIIHALRGWPTPYGAALIASGEAFTRRDEDALALVARQVCGFARMQAGSRDR